MGARIFEWSSVRVGRTQVAGYALAFDAGD